MAQLPANVPAFLQPDSWKNKSIKLYHGTVDYYANQVVAKVDHTQGQHNKDFGQGFYTTTVLDQAKSWAWNVLVRSQGKKVFNRVSSKLQAAVVELEVPRAALADLNVLSFVLGNRSADDFWSLIWHCRQGNTGHKVSFTRDGTSYSNYDLVVGPVASQWMMRQTIQDVDQFSFHTKPATNVLNSKATTKRICWRHP